jgi:hypothetical protein
MDLMEVMLLLGAMESNLTAGETESRDEIAALSSLVSSLHELTLEELSTGLEGLATQLGDHDSALSTKLADMADRVRAFEANITAETDGIDSTLEDLARLDVIVDDVRKLDTDLARAQEEIEDQVVTAKEENLGRSTINMVLLFVVLVLALVIVLMVLKMRRMGPMTSPVEPSIEEEDPVELEDLEGLEDL